MNTFLAQVGFVLYQMLWDSFANREEIDISENRKMYIDLEKYAWIIQRVC